MEGIEKFTIQVTGGGLVLRNAQGEELRFTPSEALMLLDILRREEASLKELASESSPFPMRICLEQEK